MLNWKKAKETLDKKKELTAPRDTIMIVDDEDPNLRLLKGMLSKHFKVITAKSGKEALNLLNAPGIATIVSDHRMPAMTGVEFFVEVEKRHHQATRVILTGFAELTSIIRAINEAKIFRYLTKPIEKQNLIDTVEEAIKDYRRRLTSSKKPLSQDNKSKDIRDIGVNTQFGKSNESESRFQKSSFVKKERRAKHSVLMVGFKDELSQSNPELIELKNMIKQELYSIIEKFGGFIDKSIGDNIFVMFGFTQDSTIRSGLKCMSEIVKNYKDIRGKISAKLGIDLNSIKLLAGIASGESVIGTLDDAKKSEIIITGKPTLMAIRLKEFGATLLNSSDFSNAEKHSVGICLSDMDSEMSGYEKYQLPESKFIIDFRNVRQLSYVS